MISDLDETFADQHHIDSAHSIARAAIAAMLASGFFAGAMVTYFASHRLREPEPLTALSILMPMALTYVWYYYDSIEYAYIRSRTLNLGIIFLTFAVVPYYLARSRPKGRRWKAIWWMIGIAFCYILMEILGAILVRLVAV
jgi:hypothetical protein